MFFLIVKSKEVKKDHIWYFELSLLYLFFPFVIKIPFKLVSFYKKKFLKQRIRVFPKMNLKYFSASKKVTPLQKSLTNLLKEASRYFDEQDYKKTIIKAM